ncbi:MAG: hypothetical protein ACI9HK_000177 [Pirellulaceae bacterium]|jgi:hypothetical protein
MVFFQVSAPSFPIIVTHYILPSYLKRPILITAALSGQPCNGNLLALHLEELHLEELHLEELG